MANVTFLIGNGFDLACGLKTKFSHTFRSYCRTQPSLPVVEDFKSAISRDIEKWSDFEMTLAEYAPKFKNSEELIACIKDYKLYLRTYLQNEEEFFVSKYLKDQTTRDVLVKEMRRSQSHFYDGVTPKSHSRIDAVLGKGLVILRAPDIFRYISFNYTSILDKLLVAASYSSKDAPTVMHVHGTLSGADEILGVDNDEQLPKLPYELNEEAKQRIIKPAHAEEYNPDERERALKAIKESNIICAYGLALGSSDWTWAQAIKDWLVNSENHQLVYYDFSLSKGTFSDAASRMGAEREAKENLIKRLFDNFGEYEPEIKAQIHIPTGSDIFNIKEVIGGER